MKWKPSRAEDLANIGPMSPFAKKSFSKGRFLGNTAVYNVVSKGCYNADVSLLVVLVVVDGDHVKKPNLVVLGIRGNYHSACNHVLQVTNSAVVFTKLSLGGLVFVVFGKISVLSCGLQRFSELGGKLNAAVVDLLLHFLYVNFGEFVFHSVLH